MGAPALLSLLPQGGLLHASKANLVFCLKITVVVCTVASFLQSLHCHCGERIRTKRIERCSNQ